MRFARKAHTRQGSRGFGASVTLPIDSPDAPVLDGT